MPKRQQFSISIKAHDTGNSAKHSIGSTELSFLRLIDKKRLSLLPYCGKRQNGKKFRKSLKAHDIGKTARQGKGSV